MYPSSPELEFMLLTAELSPLLRTYWDWLACAEKVLVELYQTTSHTPEALHRLTESYLSIGLREEAQASAAVLGYNFPNSVWYRDSYALLEGEGLAPGEDEESWLARTFDWF